MEDKTRSAVISLIGISGKTRKNERVASSTRHWLRSFLRTEGAILQNPGIGNPGRYKYTERHTQTDENGTAEISKGMRDRISLDEETGH